MYVSSYLNPITQVVPFPASQSPPQAAIPTNTVKPGVSHFATTGVKSARALPSEFILLVDETTWTAYLRQTAKRTVAVKKVRYIWVRR